MYMYHIIILLWNDRIGKKCLGYILNIVIIKLYLHVTAAVSSTENNRYNNYYILTNRL